MLLPFFSFFLNKEVSFSSMIKEKSWLLWHWFQSHGVDFTFCKLIMCYIFREVPKMIIVYISRFYVMCTYQY